MVVGLLTSVALAATAAVAQEVTPRAPVEVPATLDAGAARRASDRALAWLAAAQHPDGSWGTGALDSTLELGYSVETYYDWNLAACALGVMALRAAPETPARLEALERGVRWLCTTRLPGRGSDWDVDCSWPALYGFVAAVELVDDPRFTADGPRAELRGRVEQRGAAFLEILLRNQAPDGGWAYYDRRPWSRRPTWGTSFCTALVSPGVERALELGWLEDRSVFDRAVAYVRRCALPSGAYEYDLRPVPRITGGESINDVKGSLARIQVCNWALASAGEPHVTPDVLRAGLEAFFRHHRFLDVARMRPIPHEAYYANAGYFYMFGHYYAARTINLLAEDERERWHARLRPHLVKAQRRDGSTSDFLVSDYTVTAGTAYLVLALEAGLGEPPR